MNDDDVAELRREDQRRKGDGVAHCQSCGKHVRGICDECGWGADADSAWSWASNRHPARRKPKRYEA